MAFSTQASTMARRRPAANPHFQGPASECPLREHFWSKKKSAPRTTFPAGRLLIRKPHETADNQGHRQDSFALEALRFSGCNFTCEILTVVKAGPWRVELRLRERHFRREVCRSRAGNNVDHLTPFEHVRKSVPSYESPRTGILVDGAAGADPHVVGNTDAERIPKSQPIAFSDVESPSQERMKTSPDGSTCGPSMASV